MAALQAYDWPGNVRQLSNVIERTIILAPGERVGVIDIDMLPPEVLDDQASSARRDGGNGDHGQRRCARRARRSSANICEIQIRRFSGNISRTASSSAWSARRCTASSRRSGIGDKREGEDEEELGGEPLRSEWRSRGHGSKPAGSFPEQRLGAPGRPVTMFLVKGVKLQGVVTWFDNFSLLLRRDGQSQLIYKHAISTIMPAERPPDFRRRLDGDSAAGKAALAGSCSWPRGSRPSAR